MDPSDRQRRRGSGWLRLLKGSGLALAVIMAGSALSPFDREALGYAVLVAMAIGVCWWKPKLAAVALAALFANTLGWMVPAVLGSLGHPGSMGDTLLLGAITTAAAAGAVGAVGTLLGKDGRWGPTVVPVVCLLVLGGLVLLAWTSRTDPEPRADVEMETRDVAFFPAQVDVDAGLNTVRVRNDDLFWHTFTVPELNLNVTIPARGERTDTFEAPQGTYQFVCAIPGHAQLGMRGTLEVRELSRSSAMPRPGRRS